MLIKDVTRETASYRLLLKLETDVDHICKMKSSEWEKEVDCGAFIFELRESIDELLSKELQNYKKNEKKIVKDCLVEIRKILRMLQMSYRAKVLSSLTIHSMVSDIRKYIQNARTRLEKELA